MSKETHLNALQPDYLLLWYRIKRVLGQGAFGITYLAHDINLDRQVAIKEYMPGHLSTREASQSVQPLSTDHKEDFKFGLERFISEARTLTKFEHPNLIRVFNVFEANNTAYMVMNYEVGESLQEIIKRKRLLKEVELVRIILPLMSGLQKMHAQGFIHRDIKPGNIFIRKSDGSPVLLDFGSARQTVLNNPQTLTNFVSTGYAPIEQYASKSDKQGPWTDIYGMGATIYKIISGSAPLTAIDRGETITHDSKDCYIPLSLSDQVKENYSNQFLAAIDHALAFRAQDRPQNIKEWRKEFPALATIEDESETVTEESKISSVGTDDVSTLPIQAMDHAGEKTEKIKPEAMTIKLTFQDRNQATETLTPQQNVSPFSDKKKIGIAASVIAGIIVIVVISLSGGKTDKPSDGTETALTNIPPDSAAGKPGSTADSTIDTTAPQEIDTVAAQSAGDAEVIQQLLTSANNNIREFRLTTPPENNAYDQFQQALALDPDNLEAKKGIETISDKYITLAYGAINSKNTDRAHTYIKKAEEIWPESTKINAANQTLQAKMEENEQQLPAGQPDQEQPLQEQPQQQTAETEKGSGEESTGFMGGVKKWFKESAEKNKNVKKEDTASDKFIDSIGGGR